MKFHHKIRFRITFGIALIVLILFVGLGYSILIDQRQQILDGLHNNGKQLMTVIAKNSVDAIQFYNYLYLEELCITVEQTHGIAFCEIYDTQKNSLVQKSTVDATTLKQERKTGVNILILEQPILDRETNHLGKVELGLYLDDLQLEMKRTTIKLVMVFVCVIFLLALILNYFLSKFFITPVLNLSHVASLLAQKKFINVDVKPRQDEIGELVKNFDVMSDNLKKNFAKIEKQNQELKQSENKFSEVFRLSPNAYSITRISDGAMLEINNGFTKIFGYTEEDLKGTTSSELNIWATESERERIVGKLIAKGRLDNEETQYRTKDSRIIDAHVSSVIIEVGNEQVILAEVMDVTLRKRTENALRESEERFKQAQKMEAIGTLAGGIAHDFNNILSGIFGYSQLALTNLDKPQKAKDQISKIVKGAQRAAQLVQQILTFSRQTEYQKKPFKVYLEVNEALKLLRSSIPSTIEIKTNLNSRAMVLADPTKIHQLIMNLCTNAYHAMQKTGGILTVSLKDVKIIEPKVLKDKKIPPGKYLKLEVSDTGHGMDDDTLEKAFDPYYTTKKVGQGTGLGLALVQAIVDEHDGFLDVKTKPEKGTAFYIYFLTTEEKVSLQMPEKTERLSLRGKETIMVIDDEEAIREVLKTLLEDHSYQVDTFQNGVEAFKEFDTNPHKFDLVITDMTMPGMTGDELSEKILNIRADIPIILCTGFSEKTSKSRALEIGIRKYIKKPIANLDLLSLIREIFDEIS